MIKIKQLTFNFQDQKPILNDLSLQIDAGSFTLLYGPTGCGKSTLLKLIAGIYPEFGGVIDHGQIDCSAKQWGMVFQEPDRQFTMKTPEQELAFTLENLQLNPEEAKKRIELAVKMTKIGDLLTRDFLSLSGGEKQRVALGVIIAMDCDLILLDEPFASCDPVNRKFLLQCLIKLKQAGKTIMITDHALTGYRKLCDQVDLFSQNNQVKQLKEKEMDDFFDQKNISEQLHFQFPQTDAAIFEFNNFSLKQGDRSLIENQNLFIPKGHGTLLTGTNGAGKTSLFKALTKLLAYQGKVLYQKQDIQKIKRRRYLKQVAQAFQNADDQFLMVTVGEELALSHQVSNTFSAADIQTFLQNLGLSNIEDQVVYSLSGGQKKKLQLLLMLLADPKVLLLDEPFAGLDEQSIIQASQLLKEQFLKRGKTLLLISHQQTGLDKLCDYHLQLKDCHLEYVKGGFEVES